MASAKPPERNLRLGRGPILAAVGFVAALFIGYVAYVEVSARGRAEEFCLNTANGSSVEGLTVRAEAAGAADLNNPATWDGGVKQEIRWVRLPGGNEGLPVTFLGFAAHTKHYCAVTARDGIVAFSVVDHLD
jgi:hypothetical protein